jgi:hypothetical protein
MMMNYKSYTTKKVVWQLTYTDVITSTELARHVGKMKNWEYMKITSEVHITNQLQICCAYLQAIWAKRRVVNAWRWEFLWLTILQTRFKRQRQV